MAARIKRSDQHMVWEMTKHDYGKGFYLTESPVLASEWAVCNPTENNGWVHKYTLDATGLKVLDFQECDILSWLAELMKHRDADTGRRYKVLAPRFYREVSDFYRRDTMSSKGGGRMRHIFILPNALSGMKLDLDILPELLKLGDLGIQYCLKTEKAFLSLNEDDYSTAGNRLSQDQSTSIHSVTGTPERLCMHCSTLRKNKIENVFSKLL